VRDLKFVEDEDGSEERKLRNQLSPRSTNLTIHFEYLTKAHFDDKKPKGEH
jgi:hypothetical protein